MQTSDPSSKAAIGSHTCAARFEDGFLLFLGKRVRELRNRRGMTRKMMAREADVSERHLAQLEAGEGNISIVLVAEDRGGAPCFTGGTLRAGNGNTA